MLPTLRLVVTLLLLLFTLTVLGEDDAAPLEKGTTASSEDTTRASSPDPKNPWSRMSPYHFNGYSPMIWYHPYSGHYPSYPGYHPYSDYYPVHSGYHPYSGYYPVHSGYHPYSGYYPSHPGYHPYSGYYPSHPGYHPYSGYYPSHPGYHPYSGYYPSHPGYHPYSGYYPSHPGYHPYSSYYPSHPGYHPYSGYYPSHPGYHPYSGYHPFHPGYVAYLGMPQKPISPLIGMMFPMHMAQSGHPWGMAPHHWPQDVAHPWYPTYPAVVHHPPVSPLVGMMYHPPVMGHPWGALAHVDHFPATHPQLTPAQDFRWRYPGYHYPYYGHMGYHGFAPVHTSATFYPHKPQGGMCSFDQSFLCWGMAYCIQPKQMCDGIYDCPNHFDEYPHLCVEGRRPSVESIKQFLTDQGWIRTNLLTESRSIDEIAQVLKSFESVEELRWRLNLSQEHVNNTRIAFQAVMEGDKEPLKNLGMEDSAFESVKYFFKVLMDTGAHMSM